MRTTATVVAEVTYRTADGREVTYRARVPRRYWGSRLLAELPYAAELTSRPRLVTEAGQEAEA
jgi:hypothetical protein